MSQRNELKAHNTQNVSNVEISPKRFEDIEIMMSSFVLICSNCFSNLWGSLIYIMVIAECQKRQLTISNEEAESGPSDLVRLRRPRVVPHRSQREMLLRSV